MTKKSLFAAALLLCMGMYGTAVMAKPAPKTIEVVGGTGKIQVNGKDYVPGTPLPKNAKITVTGGDATMKIGGDTVKAMPGCDLQVKGDNLTVLSGSADVTNAAGVTTTIAAGGTVSVAAPAAPAAATTTTSNKTDDNSGTIPPPPPAPAPNAQQNTSSSASGSTP
jgi:hypothetical protein